MKHGFCFDVVRILRDKIVFWPILRVSLEMPQCSNYNLLSEQNQDAPRRNAPVVFSPQKRFDSSGVGFRLALVANVDNGGVREFLVFLDRRTIING